MAQHFSKALKAIYAALSSHRCRKHTHTHAHICVDTYKPSHACSIFCFSSLIFFPLFCHNTVCIIILPTRSFICCSDLLFIPLYFFSFSLSHIYTWLEHRTHGNCIWISLISAFRFNLFFSSISFVVRYFYFTYNLFYECNRVCWNIWGWTSKITRFFVIFVLYRLEVLLLCCVWQDLRLHTIYFYEFSDFVCLFSTSIFTCPFPTKKNILLCDSMFVDILIMCRSRERFKWRLYTIWQRNKCFRL